MQITEGVYLRCLDDDEQKRAQRAANHGKRKPKRRKALAEKLALRFGKEKARQKENEYAKSPSVGKNMPYF